MCYQITVSQIGKRWQFECDGCCISSLKSKKNHLFFRPAKTKKQMKVFPTECRSKPQMMSCFNPSLPDWRLVWSADVFIISSTFMLVCVFMNRVFYDFIEWWTAWHSGDVWVASYSPSHCLLMISKTPWVAAELSSQDVWVVLAVTSAALPRGTRGGGRGYVERQGGGVRRRI